MTSAETTERHNGWANFETWGVALVLDNDEGTYAEVHERAAAIREEAASHPNVEAGIWAAEDAARYLTADWLKDYVEQLCGLDGEERGVPEPSMMARQLLQGALAEVDWVEIAGHYVEEED